MKFEINRQAMGMETNAVCRIVPKRATQPWLTSVLVRADAETQTVAVIGTDLETWVETRLPAKVEVSGQALVAARPFKDAFQHGPKSTQVSLEGPTMSVGVTCLKMDMSTSAYTDFLGHFEAGTLGKVKSMPIVHVPAVSVTDAVNRCRHAVGDSTGRFALNVLELSFDKKLRITATDGHRLAHAAMELPESTIPARTFLIGEWFAEEVRKAIKETRVTEIGIELSKDGYAFQVGNRRFADRLIQDKFPNWKGMASSFIRDLMIGIRKEDILAAVEQAGNYANQVFNSIVLTGKSGELMVKAESDQGKFKKAVRYTGDAEPFEIHVNWSYLKDALKARLSESIDFELGHVWNYPTNTTVRLSDSRTDGFELAMTLIPPRG